MRSPGLAKNAEKVKRQASVQVSDESTDSDRSIVIRHRWRRMRNAPLELPDPEPD